MARVTPDAIRQMKARGERIPMLTAYDYPTACILDAAGVPLLLVGDTLGMIILGNDSTLPVTVEDIIHHTRAVMRGAKTALVVADMPFGSFQVSTEETVRNAVRIMKEAGPQAVKLEGGVRVAESVRRLTEAGIPVMGHLGLTPQSVNVFGGFKVQGRTEAAARALLADVAALEEAGVFAIVLELVPAELARLITERSSVPTIGIGAGPHCDGEVQVLHDILGLFPDFTPRHTKRYGELGSAMRDAVTTYLAEVRGRTFPTERQSAKIDPEVIAALRAEPRLNQGVNQGVNRGVNQGVNRGGQDGGKTGEGDGKA
jgi:3-methyl-2-oxobutanoate hydroxymethyltransferase